MPHALISPDREFLVPFLEIPGFLQKRKGRVQHADKEAGGRTNEKILSSLGNLLPFCYYSIQ
jgi:hypothetical protein